MISHASGITADSTIPAHVRHALDRANALHASGFGASPPTHAAFAPGRVNLIGEHTDYSGGFVLPIAIDRACVAVASPAMNPSRSRIISEHADELISLDLRAAVRPGDTVEVHSLRDPSERRPDAPLAPGWWASYAVGSIAGALRSIGTLGASDEPRSSSPALRDSKASGNIDIAIASDVPLGGGLSSSAAVEVALVTLAAIISSPKAPTTPRDIASVARKAEHEFAGVPCGIMDQYVSACADDGSAILIDCRAGTHESVPMPPIDLAAVLVLNSMARHSLASGEYAARRDACASAARIIGVPELRDATAARVDAAADALRLASDRARAPGLFEVARHVVTENARTLHAADALRRADLDEFGRLMNRSHDSLRDDYRVSCDELDLLVRSARACPGVFGARMTGGGFGGCIVALCDARRVHEIRDRVLDDYLGQTGIRADAFVTTASRGARAIPPR